MKTDSHKIVPWRLSCAPMMDWTDRHCRFFHRQFSRRTLLYTEMLTSAALVRGNPEDHLRHDHREHPVALQLGGSIPDELAVATKIGCEAGFDEINLNVGCPSDRVQSGCFGAVLMKSPELVADCVSAMLDAATVPVTVKCRIGIDDQIPSVALPAFLDRMLVAGIRRVAIHARKAWLDGLSPKENRTVPPLDHSLVLEMKNAFPELEIQINGGIENLDSAEFFLGKGLDGVMIGRAAYQTPTEILLDADRRIFGAENPSSSPHEVVRAMVPYIDRHLTEGGRLNAVTRHMLGVFAGRPGARTWRRMLSEGAHLSGAGPDLLLKAMSHVPEGELVGAG